MEEAKYESSIFISHRLEQSTNEERNLMGYSNL